MFEGHIKPADYADTGESPVLRQLRWTDLVARLAATRDLRNTLEQHPEPGRFSFAAFHVNDHEQGEPSVNHDALSHGKVTRLSPGKPAGNAAHGDRETND